MASAEGTAPASQRTGPFAPNEDGVRLRAPPVRSPEHPSAQIAAGATRDRAREMRPAPSARRARRATGSAGACGRGIVVPKPVVLSTKIARSKPSFRFEATNNKKNQTA